MLQFCRLFRCPADTEPPAVASRLRKVQIADHVSRTARVFHGHGVCFPCGLVVTGAQRRVTYRDQANVMTLLAFRDGAVEDLHAGEYSPLLEDPGLSRITDEEMKTLLIAASTKLAELLALRDSGPDAFAQLLAANWRQVKNWER